MKYIVLILMLILVVPLVSANELLYYNVEYTIDGGVFVDNEFEFNEATDLSQYNPKAPSDVENVRFEVLEGDVKNVKKARISYYTLRYLEGNNKFLTNFKLPFSADQVNVKLKLHKGSILANSIEESVFPAPNDVKSDGQRIIIEWTKEDVTVDETFSYFVIFEEKSQSLVYILLIIIVFLAAGFIIFLKKKPKKIEKPKKVKEEHSVEFHLKEDEKQVIRVLKRKNGQCLQSTLRIVTDISKSRLSRILKELEERKIIHREERGNKKIVSLKKAAWDILEQDKE